MAKNIPASYYVRAYLLAHSGQEFTVKDIARRLHTTDRIVRTAMKMITNLGYNVSKPRPGTTWIITKKERP